MAEHSATTGDVTVAAPGLLNIGRAESVMGLEDVEALIGTTPENVTYMSDFWSLSQWLRRSVQVYALLPRGRPTAATLVLPSGNIDLLTTDPTWMPEVRRYGSFVLESAPDFDGLGEYRGLVAALRRTPDQDPVSCLVHAIREQGLESARIGIDEAGIAPEQLQLLRDSLPSAEFLYASMLFRQIRAVKTDEEVTRLAEAAQLTERALDDALARTRIGTSEREIADELMCSMVRSGGLPANIVVASGERSALPNGQPTARRLRPGDVIRFDVGCRYRHYRSDISRTAVIGEPTRRVRQGYEAILAGEQSGIEALRPGTTARQVFEAAMSAARNSGLPEYRRSHVGHGIGIDGYDIPHLAPDDSTPVEEGMVLCVETPYYQLGWGGLQVEDTVVVRQNGAETLMKGSSALRILEG